MPDRTYSKQIIGLIGWLVVSFIAGGIGAAASVQASSFYADLARPDWAPPAAVFGPVWSVLYALMGIAAWLVWRCGGAFVIRGALTLFVVQLALNALWSWLFFGWHLGAPACADIVVLWGCILATLILFWRVQTLAGVLLLPYFLWVSFAGMLCFRVFQLNPQLLG